MLHFVSCATLLDNVKLTHHSQREINIDGGSLSIESSSFHDNTPNCNHFPSLRRNIHCSNAGHISIESLSSGDGSKDHPSPWISLNDCNMTGEDAKPDIPLFIPTLSTDSKSTLNKTNKAFSIEMKGTTLIPCGLYFEIVEVTSDSCSSISESSISLYVAQSLLSSLKDDMEWRGRLVFRNKMMSETSVVIQKSSVEKLSEALIVIVIVVLC